MTSTTQSIRRMAMVATALGALIAVSPAIAQDAVRDASYSNNSTESVEVFAPSYNVQRDRATGRVQRASLSQAVSYSDLDLRTRQGARELRIRVSDTARDICANLAGEIPYANGTTGSCIRTARDDAMRRADDAIREAREDRRSY